MNPSALRVFLCHSSGDKGGVRRLYTMLRKEGFDPWLDEESLTPGSEWSDEIPKAVRSCDVVVVCLTGNSVTKEGYVQKEIKLALDVADEKPEGTIYLIPARLEECDVPARLQKWQRVDLFVPKGYERLLEALRRREQQIRSREVHTPAKPERSGSGNGHRAPSALQYTQPESGRYGPWTYAFIALISFLCGLILVFLLLQNAEKLTALGLTSNLFYVVLIPLGLCAAAFLFGVLRSYASFRGHQLGGAIELGGPIVAAALVVVGGFTLVTNPLPFPLTVYVHGPGGPQDIVLRNEGKVILDLGPDRRVEAIGEKGEAYFPSIPANFRDQEVRVWAQREGYEPVESGKHRLITSSLYIAIRKKSGILKGRVQDSEQNPIKGVELKLGSLVTHTDETGQFELTIPGDMMARELDLTARAPAYSIARLIAVPNSNPIVIVLQKVAR